MDVPEFNQRLALQLQRLNQRVERILTSLYSDRALAHAHMKSLEELLDVIATYAAIADALHAPDPEASCRNSNVEQIRLMAYPQVLRLSAK